MIRAALLAAALLAPFAAHADEATDSATITVTGVQSSGITARQRAVPPQLSPADRAAYRQIFLDIDAGRYALAEEALTALPDGLLTGAAKAQLMLARGTGRLSRADLTGWLSANADLPQGPKLAGLASRMASIDAAPMPVLPQQKLLRSVSYKPALNVQQAGDPLTSADLSAAAAIKSLLATDRNAEAEARWASAATGLSPAVRTEWAHRIAWSYYGQNDNLAAIRMGAEAAKGSGQWAALGSWTVGLASYRLADCEGAAKGFDGVASRFPTADLGSAAAYWASRAHLACGRPEVSTARLETAAQSPNSFYGLLARRALGLTPAQDWSEPDFITADWNHLKSLNGARRAAALIEIGQIGLADRELRYLAITSPDDSFAALLRLAARLNLPATQYALAVRPPVGVDAPLSARFPAPEWLPARGWRVDKGLVFAHALQESNFVTSATSRTGAKGIMQLMPGTAKKVMATMADGTETQVIIRDLADPSFNIECGQTYLEELRDMSYTGGLLPKVVAAYNAGPGSVQRWNASLDDRGDPLLFIESIPFKETRHYVQVVMRNYWMYQLRDGVAPPSIDALVAGLWPKFPGMPGAQSVKLEPHAVVTAPVGTPPPSLPVDMGDDATVTAGR